PEPEWAPVTLASSAPADEEEVWQSVPVSPRAKAPAGEPGERPRKKAPTALGVLSSLGLAFGRLRESFRLTDAAPEPPAPLSPARQRLNRRLGIVCAVLSLLTVLWIGVHIHPDLGGEELSESRVRLAEQQELFAENVIAGALGDMAGRPRVYTIPENAVSAPRPDPANYGSTTDPRDLEPIIAQAEQLLDGQALTFSPDVHFMPGSEIRYYRDESILVIAWKEVINNKCCSCCEVKVAHGSQIRRKLAEDRYGSSLQLYATQMARDANAVAAINGDFYAFRSLGITVYQRQLYRCNPASVDSCFFTAGGDMLFAYAGEIKNAQQAQEFIDQNDVVFGLAFGPVLVDNGKLNSVSSYPIGEIDHHYSRSSIGMLGPLHYLLMTVNFEGDYQTAPTTAESGQFMSMKGCQKAYSLDGGQTSILIVDGEAFNRVDWDSERSVSDIVYFATAVPEKEVSP
ncbi:MAG: phosphodiester glycosidase family protein, partial [Oscillospiraceae bacterium]|nr:phosphodiester glycosidase family protein [Oscillospiraceae bacterium]